MPKEIESVGTMNLEPTHSGYAGIAVRFAMDLVGRVGAQPQYGKSERESQDDAYAFLREIVKIAGKLAKESPDDFKALVVQLDSFAEPRR